ASLTAAAGAGAATGAAAATGPTGAAAAAVTGTAPLGTRERRTTSSPSLISSSARWDSSSKSISFLILRKSIGSAFGQSCHLRWLELSGIGAGRSPCSDRGGPRSLQALDRRFQRQPVAGAPETADHAKCQVGEVRMVAEWLASEHVGQVHLDERYGYRRKSVAQRDAGMGEGAGIAKDQGGPVASGLVDTLDQLMFGIGLEADQFMPRRLRAPGQRLVDRGQGFGPVELRLA